MRKCKQKQIYNSGLKVTLLFSASDVGLSDMALGLLASIMKKSRVRLRRFFEQKKQS